MDLVIFARHSLPARTTISYTSIYSGWVIDDQTLLSLTHNMPSLSHTQYDGSAPINIEQSLYPARVFFLSIFHSTVRGRVCELDSDLGTTTGVWATWEALSIEYIIPLCLFLSHAHCFMDSLWWCFLNMYGL